MSAGLPEVRLELGGPAMRVCGFDFHEREDPPGSELLALNWRPDILRCTDLFGSSRGMFESNVPVDEGTVGYGVLWNAFKRVTPAFGEAERRALFSATAAETCVPE